MEKHQALDYSAWQLVRDLWRWLGHRRGQFIAASLLRALSELIQLYPAFALSQFVNLLITPNSTESLRSLVVIGLLWAGASILRSLTREGSRAISYAISERTALDAQLETFDHLFRLNLSWHEQSSSGSKMKRLQKGTTSVDDLLRLWTDTVIEAGIQITAIVWILTSFDSAFTIAIGVFMVTYLPLSVGLMRQAARASHDVNLAEEGVAGLTFEAISNMRSVKVLGMSKILGSKTSRAIDALFAQILVRIRRFRTRDLILALYRQLAGIGIISIAAWLVLTGSAEAGLLVLVFDYFRRVQRSLEHIGDSTSKFLVSQYAVGRMKQLLDVPTEDVDITSPAKVPEHWNDIRLTHVHFAYGEKEVLNDVSLTIRRGERVGLVGPSGAGKSTIFKLLLKEHEGYTGEITIGDVPLRTVRRDSYTKHTAVVLQETEVFNFSLRDNMTLANWPERNNQALLNRSAKIAYVTDFLPRLPDGYDTEIGEKGVRLSGGEKQRLGIARAVFKQPEILFLDEATSHLDSESEAKIQDSLHAVFQSVTAVVIAHRLSTIRQMDRIYVLERGKVVEEGSFNELLKKKGRFAEMWKRQQF